MLHRLNGDKQNNTLANVTSNQIPAHWCWMKNQESAWKKTPGPRSEYHYDTLFSVDEIIKALKTIKIEQVVKLKNKRPEKIKHYRKHKGG